MAAATALNALNDENELTGILRSLQDTLYSCNAKTVIDILEKIAKNSKYRARVGIEPKFDQILKKAIQLNNEGILGAFFTQEYPYTEGSDGSQVTKNFSFVKNENGKLRKVESEANKFISCLEFAALEGKVNAVDFLLNLRNHQWSKQEVEKAIEYAKIDEYEKQDNRVAIVQKLNIHLVLPIYSGPAGQAVVAEKATEVPAQLPPKSSVSFFPAMGMSKTNFIVVAAIVGCLTGGIGALIMALIAYEAREHERDENNKNNAAVPNAKVQTEPERVIGQENRWPLSCHV